VRPDIVNTCNGQNRTIDEGLKCLPLTSGGQIGIPDTEVNDLHGVLDESKVGMAGVHVAVGEQVKDVVV